MNKNRVLASIVIETEGANQIITKEFAVSEENFKEYKEYCEKGLAIMDSEPYSGIFIDIADQYTNYGEGDYDVMIYSMDVYDPNYYSDLKENYFGRKIYNKISVADRDDEGWVYYCHEYSYCEGYIGKTELRIKISENCVFEDIEEYGSTVCGVAGSGDETPQMIVTPTYEIDEMMYMLTTENY